MTAGPGPCGRTNIGGEPELLGDRRAARTVDQRHMAVSWSAAPTRRAAVDSGSPTSVDPAMGQVATLATGCRPAPLMCTRVSGSRQACDSPGTRTCRRSLPTRAIGEQRPAEPHAKCRPASTAHWALSNDFGGRADEPRTVTCPEYHCHVRPHWSVVSAPRAPRRAPGDPLQAVVCRHRVVGAPRLHDSCVTEPPAARSCSDS
jgi:hypothetical protein